MSGSVSTGDMDNSPSALQLTQAVLSALVGREEEKMKQDKINK